MEVIVQTFSSIWTGLDTLTIPIIECSLKTFLLAILIMNICLGLVNFFLGKHGDGKGNN